VAHFDHQQSLEIPVFRTARDLKLERETRLADAERRLTKLANLISAEGIAATTLVRWHSSRSQAILGYASEIGADLILKMSNDHRYLLGLLTNTDWELIRQSTVPTWFVKADSDPAEGVVTALGLTERPQHHGDQSIFSERDYETYRLAEQITRSFDSEITAVHAYRPPAERTGYAPLYAVPASPLEYQLSRQEQVKVAATHQRELATFANKIGLDKDHCVLRRGSPAEVVVDEAKRRGAGALVLGARELNAIERLKTHVTAEPVLAAAPCDVIVARQPQDRNFPTANVTALPRRALATSALTAQRQFRPKRAV
jgi:nucleotide-binding universal stress UspA family protein